MRQQGTDGRCVPNDVPPAIDNNDLCIGVAGLSRAGDRWISLNPYKRQRMRWIEE
jgi:hypothetical protein